MALRDGIVLQRWFDCWCPVCMQVLVTCPSDAGPMDSNYRVNACCSQSCWQGVSADSRNWWSGALSLPDAGALTVAKAEVEETTTAIAALEVATTNAASALATTTAAAVAATTNLAVAGLVEPAAGAKLMATVQESNAAVVAASKKSGVIAQEAAEAHGNLSATNDLIAEITARARRRGSEQGCPFRWWECRVDRQDTRGVYARKKEAQHKGRKLAENLEPGMFVAVQDREGQDVNVPFWIGLVVGAGADGSCVARKIEERETISGTRYDPGDYAVTVVW